MKPSSAALLRATRVIIGTCFWLAVAWWGSHLLTETRGQETDTLDQLITYVSSQGMSVEVELPHAHFLELGDAVYIEPPSTKPGAPPKLVWVGELEALLDDEGNERPQFFGAATRAKLRIHDRRLVQLHENASARLRLVPDAFVWVLDTLLTDENLPLLAREWNDTMLRHREEIFRRLTPIARDVIRDVEATVQESLDDFLERHRKEISALTRVLQEEIDEKKMKNLFEEEILPLGEEKFRPIFAAISKEVWEKLPLWSFSWRLAYEALPLTENDYVLAAWTRFAEREMRPLMLKRMDDIVAATKEVGQEALSNSQVRAQIRLLFLRLTGHPTFHSVAQSFLKEVFLDNGRFHERMLRHVRSPGVLQALSASSAHIEPMLRRMGDIVFGSRQDGITREFTRVLRAQILRKDRRRFVLRSGTNPETQLPAGRRIPVTIEWENPK